MVGTWLYPSRSEKGGTRLISYSELNLSSILFFSRVYFNPSRDVLSKR